MLRLRIENFDRLPDGGPLEYAVDRRGFDFGRDQHLDWTLPDRNRVVSGKHCEIRYYDDAYWLTDVSTNGTFLNRSGKRIQSPYQLNDGDTLSVGDYVISVAVSLPQRAAPRPAAPVSGLPSHPPSPAPAGNIWDTPQAAPPIDARDLMPRPPEADRAPEILYQAAHIPPVIEAEPIRKPQPAVAIPPQADVWGNARAAAAPQPPVPDVAAPASRARATPAEAQGADDAPPAPEAIDARQFLRRFAAGANLPEEMIAKADPGDMAELAGELLNLACQHIMQLLRARAEAKHLSRAGHRTMIQSADNNPLKFMATPEEALRVILGPPNRAYMEGRKAIDSAFADLGMHQIATLAAMQAAVTQLFDEFSPEAIAKAAETRKSLLKGGKSAQWDAFAELWAAKAGRREHGMLGAFLELFAENYDKLSKSKS